MRNRSQVRAAEKCFAALLLVIVTAPAAAAQTRVVAIGDVHGALPEFEAILKQTGLLDARRGAGGGWTGGRAVLVQLGDVVDRGPQSRQSLDLLMALEKSVPRQNGKVIALLGNHEVMAMTGDLSYVSPEDYQSFATRGSEGVREEAYRDYLDYLRSRQQQTGIVPAQDASREAWMAEHPLGYFERRDAFGPAGVYGKWLRLHGVAYQSGEVVFVHGGISPNWSFRNIEDLNDQVRGMLVAFDSDWESLSRSGIIWRYMSLEEAVVEVQRERAAIPERERDDPKLRERLERFLDLVRWLVSPENPTWYRGLATDPEATLWPRLEAMMARLKIGYIVVGHSVLQGSEIRQRFGNRVFLIDTGMLQSVFGGRASALEIQDGRFTAHAAGQEPRVLPPSGRAGQPENGRGDPPAAKAKTRPHLTNGELNAVMARRDKLVAHFEQLIAEKGEAGVLF
jgi:hypothetical protein